MEENYDKLLVKWASGELSPAEQKSFEYAEHYRGYQSIVDGVAKLKVPGQQTEDEAYFDFQQKLQNSPTKTDPVVKLHVLRYIGYAASIVLILGIGAFFIGKTAIKTPIAQQKHVTLPDNSVVMLNASTTLTYNKYFFSFIQKLHLDGEAFFEVQKGSDFSVTTSNGNVNVLGTKFNIVSRDDFFETACFEGKVQVSAGKDNVTLTSGKKVSFVGGIKKQEVSDEKGSSAKPTWTTGTSNFKSTPLLHVINQLESQFPITIVYKEVGDKLTMPYTGMFPHDDLNQALENVFLTMGITYAKDEEDSSLIILKNL